MYEGGNDLALDTVEHLWTPGFGRWVQYSPRPVLKEVLRKVILHGTGGDFSCLETRIKQPPFPAKRITVDSELIKACLKTSTTEVFTRLGIPLTGYPDSDSSSSFSSSSSSDDDDDNNDEDDEDDDYGDGDDYDDDDDNIPELVSRRKLTTPQKRDSGSPDYVYYKRHRSSTSSSSALDSDTPKELDLDFLIARAESILAKENQADSSSDSSEGWETESGTSSDSSWEVIEEELESPEGVPSSKATCEEVAPIDVKTP